MEDTTMQNVSLNKNKKYYTLFAKSRVFTRGVFLLFTILLLTPWHTFAKENPKAGTLIIYYSRTGKTKLICETLRNTLNADLLEIKDLKNREGTWGYLTAAFDAIFNRHTPIKPERIDVSPYQSIIVASPVWNWKISTPIHTFFDANNFDGKKVILITNANIHIMKYEQYGEDASFVKRFLKDYIRGKKNAARSIFMTDDGKYVGHYHLETQEKTDEEIIEETLKVIDDIKHNISSERMDVAKKFELLHDRTI